MSDIIKNRYDFILLFDVQDGNPNGDPDAGNLPRVDSETGMGLVTDVCLKRKVRNYVQIKKENEKPYDIYVKEKAVLGQAHIAAFESLGIALGKSSKIDIPEKYAEGLSMCQLPDGISFVQDDDELKYYIEIAADIEKKEIIEQIKEIGLSKDLNKLMIDAVKKTNSRTPTAEETNRGREWMCKNYYDIRTFGAVLSLKSAPNCGQVRGPIQLTFARSIDPIFSLEHSITRVAVATEKEAKSQNGANHTFGRKNTVPYGLYCAHGFISAHLADQTGFNEDDLDLFWEALKNMFDQDHSAARGMMSTRKLVVFKHNTALGNAPAHQLFDLVNVERNNKTKSARSFNDYSVVIDRSKIPAGVELIEMA